MLPHIFLQNCGFFQAKALKGVDDLESIGLFARFALQIDFYVARERLVLFVCHRSSITPIKF